MFIFLQQYFSCAVQYHNILRGCHAISQYITWVLLHWTLGLRDTLGCVLFRIDAFEWQITWFTILLCDKTHDTVVVRDNEDFVTLVSMHIVVMGCIFTHLQLVKRLRPLI